MPPGIYRLPLELVRQVAAECSSRDLAALSLTDRHFHAWVNPYLYEHNIKHEHADAAIWAAINGRLDTLILLQRAETRSSKTFINKKWGWSARFGPFLSLNRRSRSPLTFRLLNLAAREGNDDVASWLLQQGADVNAGSVNLCECRRRQTASPSWTSLHLAICHSQENTVKLLLAQNASLRTGNIDIEALHTAAIEGQSSIILHLSTHPGFNADVKDWMGRTPLHYAIMAPWNLDVIKALLEVGADVQGACEDESSYPYTPLWNAVAQGDFEAAVMLLQAGAKPFSQNDKNRKKVAPFRNQLRRLQRELRESLLEITLRKEITTGNSGRLGVLQRKVIRALLDFGCDINDSRTSLTESRTPLMLAVRNSSSATVRLLLERGADANAEARGDSALWHALIERVSGSMTDRVEKVTALLEYGADLLDDMIITCLIIFRSPRAIVDAVADNLGPENLTDSQKIPRVLAICCIFQERKMYESIKRYAQVQARATDEDIQYALEKAASSKRVCVPASLNELHPILDEMRPGLTVDSMLDQWRDNMSDYLVGWLEEIKGLERSERGASGLNDGHV